MRNCTHPHCRTGLTDDTVVYCDHGLPFCEHCTWEDGCDECLPVFCGEQHDGSGAACYVDPSDHGPMHQAFAHFPAQVVAWPFGAVAS